MEISTNELKEFIDRKKNYILIDVRNKDELIYGVIPSSVNLCLQDFSIAFDLDDNDFFDRYKFRKPSKSKLIIVYCRTGSRSGVAEEYLKNKGYNVRNYRGSVKEWSLIDKNVRMYG